jgi:hypothetical protein
MLARSSTIGIPWISYGRQERKGLGRDAIVESYLAIALAIAYLVLYLYPF